MSRVRKALAPTHPLTHLQVAAASLFSQMLICKALASGSNVLRQLVVAAQELHYCINFWDAVPSSLPWWMGGCMCGRGVGWAGGVGYIVASTSGMPFQPACRLRWREQWMSGLGTAVAGASGRQAGRRASRRQPCPQARVDGYTHRHIVLPCLQRWVKEFCSAVGWEGKVSELEHAARASSDPAPAMHASTGNGMQEGPTYQLAVVFYHQLQAEEQGRQGTLGQGGTAGASLPHLAARLLDQPTCRSPCRQRAASGTARCIQNRRRSGRTCMYYAAEGKWQERGAEWMQKLRLQRHITAPLEPHRGKP